MSHLNSPLRLRTYSFRYQGAVTAQWVRFKAKKAATALNHTVIQIRDSHLLLIQIRHESLQVPWPVAILTVVVANGAWAPKAPQVNIAYSLRLRLCGEHRL